MLICVYNETYTVSDSLSSGLFFPALVIRICVPKCAWSWLVSIGLRRFCSRGRGKRTPACKIASLSPTSMDRIANKKAALEGSVGRGGTTAQKTLLPFSSVASGKQKQVPDFPLWENRPPMQLEVGRKSDRRTSSKHTWQVRAKLSRAFGVVKSFCSTLENQSNI